jgi:ubiquinone biosynthesis protein Coq4
MKSKKVGKNVSKKQPMKGELDLDDLRKTKEILTF